MVGEFIQEKLFKSIGSVVSQHEVYEKYKSFCKENGETHESKIWFGRKMSIFGYSSKQVSSNNRVYIDIGVKE